MATNDVLFKDGTQFMFRDVTDFPSSGAGPPTSAANDLRIGTPTQVQMNLTSLGASGGGWQSAKLDLGALRAREWSFSACIEFVGTTSLVDGSGFEWFWNPSPHATAGTGNMGGTTGVDGAFTDTDGNLGQLQHIGRQSLIVNAINKGFVDTFFPIYRYGSLVAINFAGEALHTVMDETHAVMTPMVDQIQAAV